MGTSAVVMKSFIRAAEIWVPGPDAQELVSGGGFYGGLDAFGAFSQGMRFRRGEGLPGEAWDLRHPVVMGSFKGSTFRRIEEAAAVGLTSGIAMPIFSGPDIKAVVVFLCGDDATHIGAIEVWKNDPEEDAQIGLYDGYYGGAELFRLTSQLTRFGKGHGIPGAVWASDMPLVLRDIFRSDRFLRRKEALQVGLNLGLGLPFNYDPGRTWIMVFLSALGTPIAGRFEIWLPDATGTRLVYDSGLSEGDADQAAATRPASIGPGDGFLGRTLATRLPVIVEDCGTDSPWLVQAGEGPLPAISLPTFSPDGRLKAVTAWRF